MDLTLTGKTKVVSPTAANLYPSRYGWLSLEFAEPNLGAPPLGTELALLTSDEFGNRGWADFTLTQPFSSLERPDLNDVDQALEWLLYRYPSFDTFTIGASSSFFVELGTGQTVTLTWSSNKVDPRAITTYNLYTSSYLILDYIELGTGNYTFSTFSVNIPVSLTPTLTTFKVLATDWAGATADKLAFVQHVGRIFIGSYLSTITSPTCSDVVNNAQFSSLNNKISFAGNIDCSPIGDVGRRFYVAYPLVFGAIPSTTINGFRYTWQPATIINEFVYTPVGSPTTITIPYIVYISNNVHNGFIPIEIN